MYKVEFTINETHHFSGEVDGDHSVVTERNIDLSKSHLFAHPFAEEQENTGVFSPLKESVQDAFRLLSLIDNDSPFAKALLDFQRERLPQLLAATQQPEFSQWQKSEELNAFAQKHPEKFVKLAGTILERIESEYPLFFELERKLGTFDWLRLAGDSETLPFSYKTKNEAPTPGDIEKEHRILFFNTRGDQVEYDIVNKIAYLQSDTLPTPVQVIDQLCGTGSFGEAFIALNRAAAIDKMQTPVEINVRRFQERTAENSSFFSLKSTEQLFKSAILPLAFAPLFIKDATNIALHVANNSITPQDLGSAAFMGVLMPVIGMVCLYDMIKYLKARIEEKHEQDCAKEFLESFPGDTCSTFSTALLRFIENRSSGATRFQIAAEQPLSWYEDFEGLRGPDPRLTMMPFAAIPGIGPEPVPVKIDATVITENFPPTPESQQQINDFIMRNVTEFQTVSKAYEVWNMLHAIDVTQRFCINQNVSVDYDRDPYGLLIISQIIFCDVSQKFDGINRHFDYTLEQVGLTRETWPMVSRALFAADLLERLEASTRAQAIAQEEVQKALASA